MTLKHLDLFSGYGGFALGLEWSGGYETVGFCEIEDYPQQILKRHWPNVPLVEDVHETDRLDSIARTVGGIDIITGGFPCQPFSQAGRQQGGNDERYLWHAIADTVSRIRPRYIVLENVAALLAPKFIGEFGAIVGTLSTFGYGVEWQVIPAAAVGAPHRRDRVWIVGQRLDRDTDITRLEGVLKEHPTEWAIDRHREGIEVGDSTEQRPLRRAGETMEGRNDGVRGNQPERPSTALQGNMVDSNGEGLEGRVEQAMARGNDIVQRQSGRRNSGFWRDQSPFPLSARMGNMEAEYHLRGMAYGVANRVDRIKAAGNGIVPHIAWYIGDQIKRHAGL